MNISFIGFGTMAKSIARGLIKEQKYNLFASAPSLTAGTNKEGIHTHYNNKKFIKNAQILILAVKPGQMAPVLQEIALELPPKCLLISVAAGLTLNWFATRLIKPQALIRAMPNTPTSIGFGATPMIANSFVTQEQLQWAQCIFSTIGMTQWVINEEEMDTFTALSGSGPAYIFSFIDAMIKAAIILGLDEDIAKNFAIQTGIGSLKLAESSDLSLSKLRTQVTSPDGTTAAALKVLDTHLERLVQSAMQAAKTRSQELSQSL